MEPTPDIAPICGKREPKGRGLDRDELDGVFDVCGADDNSAAGARDELVCQIVLERHRLAGVDSFTPHDLRRTLLREVRPRRG